MGNIRHWMGTGLRGIVVLGSNGEAVHLEDHGRTAWLNWRGSAVPRDRVLMAGTGRDGTRVTIGATLRTARAGSMRCWSARPPSGQLAEIRQQLKALGRPVRG